MASLKKSGGASYSPWLHATAVITTVAVFPLIIVGAGVTSQDAGMAFPDWPTSAGRVFNPPGWLDASDTRWEHGHRLLGWMVGMLTIVLAALSWRGGGAVRAAGLATLIAVSVQGVVGGLRVTEDSTELAMLHGIWGQVCFGMAASAALITSRTWLELRDAPAAVGAQLIKNLCVIGAGAVLLQLILGAALRHFGGNHALVAHVIWALVVTGLLGWLGDCLIGRCGGNSLLRGLGIGLWLLVAFQLLLGGLTFLVTQMQIVQSPLARWAVPSAHVATGALLLACTILAALGTLRPSGHEEAVGLNQSITGEMASD